MKKLIDRRGFESKSDAMKRRRGKVAMEKQTELAGEGKSVRFAESEKRNGSKVATSPSTSSSSSSSLKTSSDRVNSRWVIPISKPDEAVSKKPMRRIKIEEVGQFISGKTKLPDDPQLSASCAVRYMEVAIF